MKKKNLLRKRNGFTLIELIVVIAILGILAAIIIPRIGTFTESANIKATESTHRILVGAIAAYILDNNVSPTSTTDLTNYLGDDADLTKPEGANYEISNGKLTSTYGNETWTYTFDETPVVPET